MIRVDLRNIIIPHTIDNTTDLIYLDSFEQLKKSYSRTTNYAESISSIRDFTMLWTRSTNDMGVHIVFDGMTEINEFVAYTNKINIGLRASLRCRIPKNDEELKQLCMQIGGNLDEKNTVHTLLMGEYPNTNVEEHLEEHLNETLELLYNGGKIQEGLQCTGRWYSCNGEKDQDKDFAGKHSPEFEYKDERYVRVASYPKGKIVWLKVEPISFEIKNWDDMPKYINPNGNGTAKYFDLVTEKIIISGIPFYPDNTDPNGLIWGNSTVRGYLNGTDVRNIRLNDSIESGASRGGNFTGECNFLNEAFNLSREPMIEYTIPDSESEIPDDAFNGCTTLKKLVIHPGIKTCGKRAFDGLHFEYAYKSENGELVFSQELPKSEFKDLIIMKSFPGLDFKELIQNDKAGELSELSKTLNKHNFCIPYIYGLDLIKNGKAKSFCENSDFRFFKNELQKINEMLLDFSEEEKLNFYKFASCLGCFSTEKIMDKRTKETEVIFAQRASSLLARILNTGEIKLRQISGTI